MKIKTIRSFCILLVLIGCSKKTSNPIEAYEYWAGSKPPDHIEVINGEYFESPHFTLEYELSLKLKSDRKWFSEFVSQNGLTIDSLTTEWTPGQLPKWFQPDKGSVIYCKNPTDRFDRSRYFYNDETKIWYIYETVGM